MMEFLPELIAVAGLGVVSWFANRITMQLDAIHQDLKLTSERLVRLEVAAGFNR